MNPYLPLWETIPDGEPHVFDGRIYVYGSHDRRNGGEFCLEDYVVWSAPVLDLTAWRCEGTAYKKEQDPMNGAPYDGEIPKHDPGLPGQKMRYLYAPDCAKGPDGRYYLYYSLDFSGVISVAVSEKPGGPFSFLGYVTYEDGSLPKVGRMFDPAILCEESGNYLYYGSCPKERFVLLEGLELPGAMMVKLGDDMHTIISEPVCVANGCDTAAGTGYEEHPFFEASSIRHIGEYYYFVYSPLQGHELCYGMADSPEGPFTYQGVLISNGDLGYHGNTLPDCYFGNNHGGLVQIGDKTAVFWHRQTHGTAFSRQGCADFVEILPDGTIPQVEMTTGGLSGILPAEGTYSAGYACNLWEAKRENVGAVIMGMEPGKAVTDFPEDMVFITEDEKEDGTIDPYVHNLRKGACAGFKYFSFTGRETEIGVRLRGHGSLAFFVDDLDADPAAVFSSGEETWNQSRQRIQVDKGVHAIYFCGAEGILDFADFTICS